MLATVSSVDFRNSHHNVDFDHRLKTNVADIHVLKQWILFARVGRRKPKDCHVAFLLYILQMQEKQ